MKKLIALFHHEDSRAAIENGQNVLFFYFFMIQQHQPKRKTPKKSASLKQDKLYSRLSLTKSKYWNKTTKNVNFRGSILNDLCFQFVNFCHSANFSASSLVNTKFSWCYFNDRCNYTFDTCDMENCLFVWCHGGNDSEYNTGTFVEMIRKKKITFHYAKNVDKMAKSIDESIKRAIKETYDLQPYIRVNMYIHKRKRKLQQRPCYANMKIFGFLSYLDFFFISFSVLDQLKNFS